MRFAVVRIVALAAWLSMPGWVAAAPAASGPAMDCRGSVTALAMQGYKCSCSAGKLSCGSAGAKSHSKSSSSAASMKAAMVGGILGGLLESMMAVPRNNSAGQYNTLLEQHQLTAKAARQAEQWRQSQDREFLAGRETLVGSFKQPGGSQGRTVEGNLDFKTLDGEMETQAANAERMFDTPGGLPKPEDSGQVAIAGATPFFGDTLPEGDLRLLVHPEGDPRIVNLRNAVAYVADNLKKETSRSNKLPPGRAVGEPIIEQPDCAGLTKRLSSYTTQRNKFHKTILLAKSQVDEWQTMNRTALVNAAKDGVEYFTGNLLENLSHRGKAAERLQGIYTQNASKMAGEGVNILALEGKIQRLQQIASAGKLAGVGASVNDWQTLLKHGTSALLLQLNASNEDLKDILDDPLLQQYIESERPELKTALDISKIAAGHQVFGKWVAKRLPLIAGVELGINQTYNGTQWLLSFNRLVKAHQINGQVMDSARSLQQRIEETRNAMSQCP